MALKLLRARIAVPHLGERTTGKTDALAAEPLATRALS